MKGIWALFADDLLFPLDQSFDKPALHEKDDQDRRQHNKQRAGHGDIPIGNIVHLGNQMLQADHCRGHVRIGCDKQRPEILVPSVNEFDHNQGGNV